MGHAIEAIIVNENAAGSVQAQLPGARYVSLPQGFVLFPLIDDMVDVWGTSEASMSSPDSAFWKLGRVVLNAIEQISHEYPIAYIETDYFGGTGEQAAGVWREGRPIFPPRKASAGPINDALRALGVAASPPNDEFDTIGLGRHRDSYDWLDECGPDAA